MVGQSQAEEQEALRSDESGQAEQGCCAQPIPPLVPVVKVTHHRHQRQSREQSCLQARQTGPHHASVDSDHGCGQAGGPPLAGQTLRERVRRRQRTEEADCAQELPGLRKAAARRVEASQENRPERSGGASRGLTGIEGEAVTPSQIAGELKMDPRVVEGNPLRQAR